MRVPRPCTPRQLRSTLTLRPAVRGLQPPAPAAASCGNDTTKAPVPQAERAQDHGQIWHRERALRRTPALPAARVSAGCAPRVRAARSHAGALRPGPSRASRAVLWWLSGRPGGRTRPGARWRYLPQPSAAAVTRAVHALVGSGTAGGQRERPERSEVSRGPVPPAVMASPPAGVVMLSGAWPQRRGTPRGPAGER